MSEGTAKKQDRQKFQAVRGTRDILPPESALWKRVEQAASDVFAAYGYGEIRVPIFEQTELFARSVGGSTDIVSKEMYTFEDSSVELLRARENVRNFLHTPGDQRSSRTFRGFLRDFETRVKNGLRFGEVEHDERGKKLYDYLEHAVAYYDLLLGKPQNAENNREIDRMVEGLRLSVYAVPIGKMASLRPEATAAICRAYIEHGMHTLPGDVKLYCMGPMFRRERPQKGRYRQFYQIDAEVLGQSDNPGIDAELIEMLLAFLDRSGLAEHTLYINSIGDRQCRPKYVEVLRAALMKIKDKLGADSQRRIETNPLRVLDSKVPEEQAIIDKLPRIAEHLCEDCRVHFAVLKDQLKLRGIAYEENWRLVRGLDYYMRTTFEVTAPGLGAQNAVCGGGRYDGLVEMLGGPPTKGIGFALGTDRLVLALQHAGKGEAKAQIDVFIAWLGAAAYPAAVRVARTLRNDGFAVELPHDEMKFKKSLGLADRLGARFAVILGENEVAAGTCAVKRLADGTQQTIGERDLAAHLKSG